MRPGGDGQTPQPPLSLPLTLPVSNLECYNPQDDVRLWMPDTTPSDLEPEMARFLLSQVGDQFCDLIQQETEAQEVNMAKGRCKYRARQHWM